ncbi:MAG TPA: MFS transporter, partial [Gaiellales bacterium]|nr:MFS transporter [Gaiellales bacterium]
WAMVDDRIDGAPPHEVHLAHAIEWRVVALSTPLFLYTYSYGAVSSFSAYYANALDIHPRAIYLTTLALVTLVSRPVAGRFGDRLGHRRLFMPSLVIIAVGMTVLAFSATKTWLVISAALFALGFGTAYPAFAAWVMLDVHEARRGAAFGAILAAYDTGIGSGSTLTGWLIGRYGFGTAFGVAAALAALALPAFLLVERRFGHSPWKPEPETTPPPGDPLFAPAPFEE